MGHDDDDDDDDDESFVSRPNEFFSQPLSQSIQSLTVFIWKMSSSSRSTETKRSIQPLLLFSHRRKNLFSSKLKSSVIDSTILTINTMTPRLLNSHVSIKPLGCGHDRSHSDLLIHRCSSRFSSFFFFSFLSIYIRRSRLYCWCLDLCCISSFHKTVIFLVFVNKKTEQEWILFIFVFLTGQSVMVCVHTHRSYPWISISLFLQSLF